MDVSRTQLILRRGVAFVLDHVVVVLVYLILSLGLHGLLALPSVSAMLELEQQRWREPYLHSILFMVIGPLCFVGPGSTCSRGGHPASTPWAWW